MNPVNGAVGLLWTGNWHVCQSAVETVLGGGVLRSLPELEEANNNDLYASPDLNMRVQNANRESSSELELGLTAARVMSRRNEKKRPASPSDHESDTTTLESGFVYHQDLHHNCHGHDQTKLLQLFS